MYLLQITAQQRRLRVQSNAGDQRALYSEYVARPSVFRLLTGVPVSRRCTGGGAAWWQRDERGLEGDALARPPARMSAPPPLPTHTWVAIHESRSYVRQYHRPPFTTFSE